ncbi:MAG: substrate-binding domain-containing protein [Treponema sp.]|jgi:phosphate transport system substrate-binding protein|nr:substrate-binding domain-containing protein [Treponema sp.]
MKKIIVMLVVLFLAGNSHAFAEEPKRLDTYVNLWDYSPFNGPPWNKARKSKIAVLNEQPSLQFAPDDDFPKLDGATAFYPLYAAFVQAVYPAAIMRTVRDGSQNDNPVTGPFTPEQVKKSNGGLSNRTIVSGDQFMRDNAVVQCSRTGPSYKSLLGIDTYREWRPDIIFCYEPSSEERDEAAGQDITFNMVPLGYDAFVFIVNKKNPVNNLTQQQARDIYSGKITNWKSVGGIDREIIPYQRPKNSGSQTILEKIMGDTPLAAPRMEAMLYTMTSMIEAVADYANYENAIGYSFRFFTTGMVNSDEVKILSIDGVYPSTETIQNKTYPYFQPFYAVTAGNEKPNTRRFIDWMLSPQGQYLVEKTGYVPVRP